MFADTAGAESLGISSLGRNSPTGRRTVISPPPLAGGSAQAPVMRSTRRLADNSYIQDLTFLPGTLLQKHYLTGKARIKPVEIMDQSWCDERFSEMN